jgi:hypothetical protein
MWLKKLFGLSAETSTDGDSGMKEIIYRGGLVTFSIPANWAEEYGDDGGAVLYDPVPDSGTLRLSVLTVRADETSEKIDVDLEVKQKAKETGGSFKILDEGNALVCYDQKTTEEDHEIAIRLWNVYNPIPPSHLRVATFSYTLLESQMDLPKYLEELEMLDRQIAEIRFATHMGIQN